MKGFSTLILVCLCSFSFTQTKEINTSEIKGYIGIAEKYQLYNIISSEVKFGVNKTFQKSSIVFYGLYQIEGNVKMNDGYEHYPDIIRYVPSYYMQNHFLGLGMRYRFRSNDKIYAPTLSFDISKEFATNYKGKYIQTLESENFYINIGNKFADFIFIPTKQPAISEYYSGHGFPPYKFYATYYYVSTPIKGLLSFDNELKIMRDLYINVGIFYSFRLIKMRYKSWSESYPEPIPNISNFKSKEANIDDRRIFFKQFIGINLGVNYTFSFKRHPRTTKS